MSKTIPLTTQCACLDDEGNIWIFSNNFNGLFCMERESYKIKFVRMLDLEETFSGELYNRAIWYNGKIVLFPVVAKAVAIYDARQNTVRYVTLQGRGECEYYNAIRISETEVLLYMQKYGENAYVFSLEKETYKRIKLNYGENEEYLRDKLLCGSGYVDGRAYLAVLNEDKYLSFNIAEEQVEIYPTGQGKRIYQIISQEENTYVLSACRTKYDIYDRDEYKETIYLRNESQDRETEGNIIFLAVCQDGIVVCLPESGSPLCFFKDNKLFKVDLHWEKIHRVNNKIAPFFVCCVREGKLILLPYGVKTMVVVDLDKEEAEYIDLEISYAYFVQIYREHFQKRISGDLLSEGGFISLELLFNLIEEKKSGFSGQQLTGKEIYKNLTVNKGETQK